MRIVELINTLDTGGAERMVATLGLELQNAGHQVHVLCLREMGVLPVDEAEFQSAGVALVAFQKDDGFSVRTLLELVKYFKRHAIDVVHTHTHQVHHYGALAGRFSGAGAIVNTVHGISALEMQAWARNVYRLATRLSDRTVSVCEAVNVAAKRTLSLSEAEAGVIYNGIAVDELLPLRPRQRDGRFVFGTIGRLVPIKDHHTLLEAFALVSKSQPCSRLEILGDGEMRGDLETFAIKLGISDSVRFRGFSLDRAGFLSGLDCFVLSSRSEGLPLTVLEGMAAGLPVVATTVGGITEIVEGGDCGWLCPPGRPAEMAAAMEQAIRAVDRVDRGARGRDFVVQQFTVSKMARSYLELFDSILSGHAKAVPGFSPS